MPDKRRPPARGKAANAAGAMQRTQRLRCIALLRGINVGAAKRVPMAELRALLEGLGYMNVRTLLNSGNAVFDDVPGPAESGAGARAARIEAALAERFGFAVPVIVIEAQALARAISGEPFGEGASDPARFLVAFFRDGSALAAAQRLAQRDWSPERLVVTGGVAYLWCPAGVLAGALFTAYDRALGTGSTARNWATLAKLQALAASDA